MSGPGGSRLRRLFVTCGVFTRYFFVAFPWLFRGPLLFRGFFVAPVVGKIYAYLPWNSLLTVIQANDVRDSEDSDSEGRDSEAGDSENREIQLRPFNPPRGVLGPFGPKNSSGGIEGSQRFRDPLLQTPLRLRK